MTDNPSEPQGSTLPSSDTRNIDNAEATTDELPVAPPADSEVPATQETIREGEIEPGDPGEVVSSSEEGAEPTPNAQGTQERKSEDSETGRPAKEEADEEEEEDDDDDTDEGEDDDGDEEDEDEDEDDDEPKLKYARLTHSMGSVYRNGDATSAFVVAGDKMIIGTHNGNIHVLQLPLFQALRVYHAHSASVTSLSISPDPPPSSLQPPNSGEPDQQATPARSLADSSPAVAARKPREAPQVPNIPSNQIYIATSSTDGHVCIQSLVDVKDVQLRNFARPVQAVALSPEYRTDRMYLSGGLAGQLILTTGGQPGRSVSTTTGTVAAAASGWLGSIGLGQNTGKDTILHSGEGTIPTIRWSRSGKYVVWLNEMGIKIMRSKLHLETADADDAWKRIGHIDRPQTEEWDTMASVWKGRVEWIDEEAVERDDDDVAQVDPTSPSPAVAKLKERAAASLKRVERLLVGWGGTIWIIHVHPGGIGVGRNAGEKSIGHAEIVKILRMDCIISGISLYTQNLLLVLAYSLPDEDGDDTESLKQKTSLKTHSRNLSVASGGSEPSGGIRRRLNNQPPELRLIDLKSQGEVDKDGLSVSRYERLSAGDYHLGVLPAQSAASADSSRGALEALAGLGSEVWNAAINPMSIFNSGASVRSNGSGNNGTSGSKAGSPAASSTTQHGASRRALRAAHPHILKPGVKIFIHSPYDCILATKRDLSDHLVWLVEHQQYRQAWELLDENPDILATPGFDRQATIPSTPAKAKSTPEDTFEDASSSVGGYSISMYSNTAKEKRRIGELWIQELVEAGDWVSAGEICGKVLETADRWEKWVWTFAGAGRFDDVVYYMPIQLMNPPIPGTIYEVVLGHYIQTGKLRFQELLDRWPPELFDVRAITTALENQLKFRDVREDSIENGVKGRDWRIVMESLAKLHEAIGRRREALKCYIKLQDADAAFRLIREGHLVDAVADDIPSFIGLRVLPDELPTMTEKDLEEATAEAINLLVDEAQHGLVTPALVVSQLEKQDLPLYLFFYLRGLWKGEGIEEHTNGARARLMMEVKSLVDGFADLAVSLFARFDRPLLIDFLKKSTSYTFEKAVQECESCGYDDELIFLYSKTGQMKRALFLIIDRLRDVKKAIEFAKEQDDPDLWEDLLNYSMDKPSFIRGLLEQVGTAINPITLVRRIPEGLEIDGLREGLKHIVKEHEIQFSISSGANSVLQSEVGAAQAMLRNGQQRGVKFEVSSEVEASPEDQPEAEKPKAGPEDDEYEDALASLRVPTKIDRSPPKPGHCPQCHAVFTAFEMETLVGFACGHVFHQSHLLEMLYPGQSNDGFDAHGDHNSGHRYYVGPKVTHARLLRSRVRSGCPICFKDQESLT